MKLTPVKLGIAVGGTLAAILFLLFFYVFGESSSAFFPFALLLLVGCPLAGAVVTRMRTKGNWKVRASLVSGSIVLAIVVVLATSSYVVIPLFIFNSTPVPNSCMNNSSGLPSDYNYTIPRVGTGTLLGGEANSVAVAMVDHNPPTFNSTVFLVNETNNETIWSIKFSDDIVAATISNGVLYLFDDKLGYFINAHNGEPVSNVIETDNYRGLYSSNNATFIQTNEEFSAINTNGSVLSHVKLNFRSIAYGCFFQ